MTQLANAPVSAFIASANAVLKLGKVSGFFSRPSISSTPIHCRWKSAIAI